MELNKYPNAKVGILQFPGSNCDFDCIETLKRYFDVELIQIWHTTDKLPELDGLILPGGFSYGDYLRGGSLASHAPILNSVKEFVSNDGSVIGICNGFQILTESHLLPGILLRNFKRKFVCHQTILNVESGNSIYHQGLAGSTLQIPIAHGEGRYYIDQAGYEKLEENKQILFRYVDANGKATEEANPNGAVGNIAGICSENGKVIGMMPHPERACDMLLGSTDGLKIWELFLRSFS